MKSYLAKAALLVLAGFAAGILVSNVPRANAANAGDPVDIGQKRFLVSIDEIQTNFVFGDEFSGSYTRTLTLSDGSTRTIQLTPMLHDGMQVVEFKDSGGHTYMGLNGTTTNGKLMVQLRDRDAMEMQLKAEGWNMPASSH